VHFNQHILQNKPYNFYASESHANAIMISLFRRLSHCPVPTWFCCGITLHSCRCDIYLWLCDSKSWWFRLIALWTSYTNLQQNWFSCFQNIIH